LAKAAADAAPDAKLLIIANPVNSTVPICAEVYKSKGVYDPKKLFGVTTLDIVRASRFISEIKKTDPANEKVVVVGGHSGVTIVPLLSQSNHPDISGEALDKLVYRIQFGGDEVVKAKDGAGSATLSMAMAGARMTDSILRAVQGETGVVECTFVESPLYKDQGVTFFSSPVELGPDGVKKIHDIGKTNDYEKKLVDAALVDLKKNIDKGVDFVKQNPGT
jgi:malate dehydrogenase